MRSKIGDMHGDLRKAKSYYTSLPDWIPITIKDYIEDRLWWVSKVHDNMCGVNGKGSLFTAHYTFIKGLLFKSELPWLLRPIFAIIALPVIIIRGHGDYKKGD